MTVLNMLGHFDHLMEQIGSSAVYDIEPLAPRVFVIKPKAGASWQGSADKPIALSIVGLIHGVELSGLGILCGLLELIVQDSLKIDFALGVAVGNAAAAEKSVRFVERDLNRSFGRQQSDLAEERRADELERLLLKTKYFIDFHQVKMQVPSPFWIFPYTKAGFDFARAVAPDVPLITHWGKGFSADGQCSDEFVNKNGGVGITMEVGQNGFDARQIGMGVHAALQCIAYVRRALRGEPYVPRQVAEPAAVYTWAEVVPYPNTGKPVLDAGWSNFQPVKKGQRLGEFNGKEILASTDGWSLFPKYPDIPPSGVYSETPPAAELIRILRKIDLSELPS